MKESHTRSRALAEIETLFLPLHIWCMIWEEIVPKEHVTDNYFHGERLKVYRDIHEITIGKYGLVRLMALRNLLSQIYWGYYPSRDMILQMISHRIGDRNKRFKRKGEEEAGGADRRRPAMSTAEAVLRVIVTPVGKVAGDGDLGWFVLKKEYELLGGRGNKQVDCICWEDENVPAKISAVMRTAMEVGKIARSEPFVVKYERNISNILQSDEYGDDIERNRAIFRLLNAPCGESLTMDLCREIRRCLKRYGFGGESEQVMDVDAPRILFEEMEDAVSQSDRKLKRAVKIEEDVMQQIHGVY